MKLAQAAILIGAGERLRRGKRFFFRGGKKAGPSVLGKVRKSKSEDPALIVQFD